MAQTGMLVNYLQRLAARGVPPGSDQQLLDAFSQHGDEAAFTALVARHGPMVLRICRRVLGQEQDAEDAFQATFVVLAQHSGSIRKRGAVSEWLHGVAYRTAMKAKRSAARRRNHEAKLRTAAQAPRDSPSWEGVQAILDEEIQRLPQPARQAFVLCVLQGKSGAEAAAELGCKEGTVKSRLSRARRTLQQRLARRGIELSALLAALCVAETGRAALPVALLRATARFGLVALRGGSAPGTIPDHVATLAAGVSATLFPPRGKIAVLIVLAASVIAGGAGVLACQAGKPAAPEGFRDSHTARVQPASVPTGPRATHAETEKIEVTGRVLGPDGKPVAGAKLFVCDLFGKAIGAQALTDGAGRFDFTLASADVPTRRVVLAKKNGLGVDWIDLEPGESPPPLTLRLAADVPVDGKVVDLEGRPIAHAVIRVVGLSTSRTGNLDEFLKQWKANPQKSVSTPAYRLLVEKTLRARAALAQLPGATTDSQGRFHLAGIGRDRAVLLGIRATGMADQYLHAITRPGFRTQPGQLTLFGPGPTAVLEPAKPILGTVRDAQTKQPLAGVRVICYTPAKPIEWLWYPLETVTDIRGHYRLDGLSKASEHVLVFDPGPGAVQIHRFDDISDTPTLTPVTHDTELYRGVVILGQVIDQATGRPVRARVVYAPLRDNTSYERTPGYPQPKNLNRSIWIDSREMVTGPDGRYRLTALPGHGALFVQALVGAKRFTQPTVPQDEQDPAIYYARAETFWILGQGDNFPMGHLNAYRLIRPAVSPATLEVNFALQPALSRRGRLIDPDGQPLSGAEAYNLTCLEYRPTMLAGAEFSAGGLSPARPRRLLFWQRQRKLAGTVVLAGKEHEPVTVTLYPLATITGRVLRKNGQPLVGYRVEYSTWPEINLPVAQDVFALHPVLTDKDGRFRLDDVPAGLPLTVDVLAPKERFIVVDRRSIVLKPGKTTELGDLRCTVEGDSGK